MAAELVRAAADLVAVARAAQPDWALAPLEHRTRPLGRFHELVVARRAELVDVIMRENGKARPEALAEIALTVDLARFYARIAERELAPRKFTPGNPALWRKRVTVTREPLGVVGVISPWNYPLMLPAGPIIAALVAGNAVLFKPSELTPGCGAALVGILHEAGIPRDVLHVVQGDGSAGAAVVEAGCDKIFFTGSEAVGRQIAARCGAMMIPCSLELGGSDPAIVLPDADVALAARGIAWGRFQNAGQTCVAPKRVIAVGGVHDKLVELLAEETRRLAVGRTREGAEVGHVISLRQREELDSILGDSVDRGARVRATAGAVDDAHYFPPTIITGVTGEMRVMREETFGPLLPVTHVRTVDEAVELANATSFGLSASVWGRDPGLARSVAARLEVGSVSINDVSVTAGIAEAPHGGVKSSGMGRMHGVEGLLECTRTKTIVEDRLPALGQPWWHRYNADVDAGMDHFVDLAHGRSIVSRLRGLFGVRRLFRRR
jgi:acyl-CoA reductase-like NAD-dependent aldehyde dehydrogenase